MDLRKYAWVSPSQILIRKQHWITILKISLLLLDVFPFIFVINSNEMRNIEKFCYYSKRIANSSLCSRIRYNGIVLKDYIYLPQTKYTVNIYFHRIKSLYYKRNNKFPRGKSFSNEQRLRL